MASRASSIFAWVCIVLVASFNLFAAIMKFVPQAPGSPGDLMMQQFGITPTLDHILGVLELCIVVLYVIPRTSTIGFVLLIGYMGGALATNITHGFTFMDALPIYITFVLMTAAAYVKNPELLARAKGKWMA